MVKAMQRDLNIFQYAGESIPSYEQRLLYSACAQWVRYFVLDQNEMGEYYPKSKKYLLRRGKETIPYLIEAFPECVKWFSSEGEEWTFKKFIQDIREDMIATGELLIDEEHKVCVPSFTRVPLIENIDRIKGISKSKLHNEAYVGITRIAQSDSDDLTPYRLRIDSRMFSEKLFSEGVYSTCNDIDKYEFFNPESKNALYLSWDNKPNNNKRFAFARIQIINGLQEYYLFRKKEDDRWENVHLQEYYKDSGEYRRIMLALRAEAGNPMQAIFKERSEVVLLKLFCHLPRVQEMQLRTFCWPMESYDDRLNYVVPRQIWPAIMELLADLNIKLRESRENE